MFAMGLDIGYSNLKLCTGDKECSTHILPVGVLPDAAVHNAFMNAHLKKALRVTVEDEAFYAGVSQDFIGDRPRTLHEDYPSTVDYRAMFAAALVLASQPEIDHLVTGLPASQFLDSSRVKALRDALTGEHKITPKRTVKVKKVTVVPQPIGGYMSAFQLHPEMDEMRVLVVDPGFFSVDWVIIREGAVEPGTMGTSLKAMSVLLEETAMLIQEDHGGRVAVEDIEKAIRNGKDAIRLFGESVELKSYLQKASASVASLVMTSVRSDIRSVKSEVDAVLLVGGGATLYHHAAADTFPRAKVFRCNNPVSANAEGFWHLARVA